VAFSHIHGIAVNNLGISINKLQGLFEIYINEKKGGVDVKMSNPRYNYNIMHKNRLSDFIRRNSFLNKVKKIGNRKQIR